MFSQYLHIIGPAAIALAGSIIIYALGQVKYNQTEFYSPIFSRSK